MKTVEHHEATVEPFKTAISCNAIIACFYNLGLSKNRMAQQLSKDAKTKSQHVKNNYTVQKEFKLFFCHKQGWLNW